MYRIEYLLDGMWVSNEEDRSLSYDAAYRRKGHYLRYNLAGLQYRIVKNKGDK